MYRLAAVGIIMLALLSSPPLSAQGDIAQYQSTSHKVVFVTGEVSQHLSAYQATVSMQLVGPVFNDVGWYSRYSSTASKFGIPRDLAENERTMRRTPPLITGWEGLTDDQYNWSLNPVLIGWGEYEFTVEIAGEEKHFFLSTLDGNWLDPTYGDDNKIVFYVDFYQADAQDPIDIQIQVYNYGEQTWEAVDEAERVTFWGLQGVSRERDKLVALSSSQDVLFTIAGSVSSTPVEVPFYNDMHHFDVNVVVLNPVYILSGKAVVITDYEYQENSSSYYSSTRWLFGSDVSINATGGELITYSLDPWINNGGGNPRMAVELFPLSINPTNRRKSWEGLKSWDQLGTCGAVLSIRDTWIRNAEYGVNLQDGATGNISRSWVDSCRIGINVGTATLIAKQDTIRDCEVGIRIFQHGVEDTTITTSVLVDSCQIWRNALHGIHLGQTGESVVIRRSEIKFNNGHGIFAFLASADIRYCNISKNGWLWGTPLNTVSPDYEGNAGIYAMRSGTQLRVHGCDFSSNVGPGIYAFEAEVRAHGNHTEYDEWDAHGSNCFDGNQKSFFADYRSFAHFGRKDDYADVYTRDLNSLRNPRFRIPTVDGPWVNLHVRHASVADFEHNYWLPDGITWFVQSTEPVSTSHRITNPAEVRCGEGWTGGPTYESPLTENTRTLVRLVTNDSLAAAWQHCKNYLSDQFNGEDAAIYAWALQSIRLAGGLDSAQILLESKAFGGAETALSAYSLLNLRGIYMILGDSTSAWKVYDTLNTRLPLEDVVMDTLTVALYKSDLLWYINKDSVLAADHISALYAAYPNDIGVRTMYVEITNDTLAYWDGALEELEKSSSRRQVHERPVALEVFGCHPNPGSSLTTIRYYVPEVSQVELRLYTTDGRLVDVLPLGTRNAGVHHHQYSAGALPSGMYIGVLTDGAKRASFKLLLEK